MINRDSFKKILYSDRKDDGTRDSVYVDHDGSSPVLGFCTQMLDFFYEAFDTHKMLRRIRKFEQKYPELLNTMELSSQADAEDDTKPPANIGYLKDVSLTILTVVELDGPQIPEILVESRHWLLKDISRQSREVAIWAMMEQGYLTCDESGCLVLKERS